MNAIKVKREEFLNRLESVSPGLSPRDIVEQSSCFVFQKGKILTFNDEISCRIPSKLGKEFLGACPAKPLMALLSKLTEEEIGLEIVEGEMIVSGIRRKAGLRMESEVLLAVSSVEEPGEWKPLPEDFADAVQIVAACSSEDDTRFSLTCVHFHPKYLEACDNFQLTRYKMSMNIETEFLVRHESMKHITTLGMTEFSETEAWLHFKNPKGLILSCRRYLEEFPNLTDILKVSGETITLPPAIVEDVDKAEIFSSESTEDNKILVQVRAGKMRIKGQGSLGWFQASKKLKYNGDPIEFLISPKLLTELVKRYNQAEITSDRLKVSGERFVYVACLSKVEDKEEAAETVSTSEEENE